MARMRMGGLVMAVAIVAAGCGDSGVQEGPAGFTPTDTAPLQPMIKEMQEAGRTKAYLKKPAEATDKEKSKEAKKG